MKYLRRVIKYFIFLSGLLTLLLTIMISVRLVEADINVLFKDGWMSVLMIAGIFAVMSAFYPYFGYGRRYVKVNPETDDIKEKIISYMDRRNYVLESEEGENMTFRSNLITTKLLRVWEDRISLNRILSGFEVEGPTRDIVVVVFGLNEILREEDIASEE